MNLTHGKCSLYLTPDEADFKTTDLPTLIEALQHNGLISKQVNPKKTELDFFTGDKFLDYIAYMGCSPSIQFESDTDNSTDFCFIKIHNYTSPRLIHSKKQARAPHCPHCKQPVKDWQDNLNGSTIHCSQCNTSSNIGIYDWRKMAGYAQLFIEVTDIFPKEAIPQQLLLDKLAGITGVEWVYFYSCK